MVLSTNARAHLRALVLTAFIGCAEVSAALRCRQESESSSELSAEGAEVFVDKTDGGGNASSVGALLDVSTGKLPPVNTPSAGSNAPSKGNYMLTDMYLPYNVTSMHVNHSEPSVSVPKVGMTNYMMWLASIGGGTGAHMDTGQNRMIEQEMIIRVRYQDRVVMFLLLAAYVGSLLFSASIAHKQAMNTSPITYYADPRHQDLAVEGNDPYDFLNTFNQPPKDVHLQVFGYSPMHSIGGVSWLDTRFRLAFSFALDLSSWIVREQGHTSPEGEVAPAVDETSNSASSAGDAAAGPAAPVPADLPVPSRSSFSAALGYDFGISEEEEAAWRTHLHSLDDGGLEQLRGFLQDGNTLGVLEIEKEVEWRGWEELATNIKLKIRQSGFTGKVVVRRSKREDMRVYQNRHWANFMHSRVMKVLFALSVIGWIFYHPYMWLRMKVRTIKSRYRVEVSICSFWPLIEAQLSEQGFVS